MENSFFFCPNYSENGGTSQSEAIGVAWQLQFSSLPVFRPTYIFPDLPSTSRLVVQVLFASRELKSRYEGQT